MAKNSFLKDMAKLVENEYASVASEGTAADIKGYIDTGSYILNALVSGSIYKGLPANKIFGLAGEESTGKTFFMLGILKNFLDANKKGVAVIFETEGSITSDLLKERNIDLERVLLIPVETVQQFKTQAIRIVEKVLAISEKEREPMIMCLDSLGMLSTSKEMADTESGKETKDMTRTQEIKATFRVLTLKLSKANIPFIVTNHVYQTMGMFPTKEVSGGCLVAGTKIIMQNGTFKNIENVQIGDNVQTRNGIETVTNTFIFQDKEVFEISFDDGTTIKCSGDHKFLINGIWKSVYSILALDQSTEILNIEVETLNGEASNVYTEQIY